MIKGFTISRACIFYSLLCCMFLGITFPAIAIEKSKVGKLSDENEITVSGTVKDETGVTLPGVSVLVKGTTKGTITNFDGQFKLNVASDGVLIFSYIGYKSKEVAVNNQTVINLSLEPDQEVLEEVVVVGYGVQKKKSVVGAITQTSNKELMESGGATDMTNSLTGRVPGMSIVETSAQPGEGNAEILIRGKSSWSGNDPLVLVDGIERNFNDIDPNEIESISVLKDASATAVFGVKGANGVILITSKQGKDEKTKITVSTEVGVKEPTYTYQRLNVAESFKLTNQAMMNDGLWDKLIPQSDIDMWSDPNRNMYLYPDVNWTDEVIGSGIQYKTNLNLSGGSKKVKYFTSIGYLNEGDIFNSEEQDEFNPAFFNERINFRTNLNFKLSKSTKLGVGLAGNYKTWNAPRAIGTSDWDREEFFKKIYRSPSHLHPVQFEDGSYGWEVGSSNPMADLNASGSTTKRRSELYTNLQLDQDLSALVEGLSVRGKLAFDTYNQFRRDITKDYATYDYQESIDPETGNSSMVIMPSTPNFNEKPANIGSWNHSSYRRTFFYELSARYNRTFGKHAIGALALFSRRINEVEVNFPFYEENWAGRITYDYNTKYLAEINLGVNGSDNFAPGKRYGIFPAYALGWVISEESFIKDNLSWVNYLKVRYSYGTVGRSHINNSTRHLYFGQYYTKDDINWKLGEDPYNLGTHYFEGRMPNEEATWEKAVKQNLGIEATVFRNFTLNLDFFNEHRFDILMERRNLPVWSGFTGNPYANIGEVKSRGMEIMATYKANITKDLKVVVSPNFSVNESRILERDDPFNQSDYQKQQGKPIGWKSGYLTDGLYDSWDDIYNSPATNIGHAPIPGDIKYIDFDGNGLVDIVDKTALAGLAYPTTTYGLSLSVKYKGLSVSALVYGVHDRYASIPSDLMWGFTKGYYMVDESHRNTWNPDTANENANPILHFEKQSHNAQTTAYNWKNASYWRLKNVEIGYNLKTKTLFDNIYLYASGSNLFTSTDFDDRLDPANSNKAYPLVKRYNFGVRLNIK